MKAVSARVNAALKEVTRRWGGFTATLPMMRLIVPNATREVPLNDQCVWRW
jgi:hypothetical protein